jgi:hypothetical protein
MWAYGNHYKVDVETWPTHAKYDSGVACIFKQGSCSFVWDKKIVVANLHYVGVIIKRNNCSVSHQPMCNIDEMFMDTCSHTKECNNRATRQTWILGSEPWATSECKPRTLCAPNSNLTSIVQPWPQCL